jgi:hypothetical protein
MRSLIAVTLGLLIPFIFADAQVISGRITDNTGLPMAAASVYIQELHQGTTTNSDGYYEITLTEGTYNVSFQFLGYTPVIKTFTVTTGTIVADIILNEQLFEIPPVRVSASGRDPAYYIMRKAIGMAPYHMNQVKMYRAEVYIRGGGSVDRIPEMVKKRMKIEANEGELQEGRYYFSESVNIITFTSPDKYVHRVISSNSNFPSGDDQASPMDYLEASFYQPVLADIAISPLAPDAFSHYRFTFLGSSSQGDFVIDKISVTPRRKSQQLFAGVIYIVEDLWAIHSLDLTNENLAGNVRVRQLYTPVEEGIWMPVSHQFDLGVSVMGIRARASYTSTVKYLEVEPDRSVSLPVTYYASEETENNDAGKTKEQMEIDDILSKDDLSARDMSRLVRLNTRNARLNDAKPSLEIEDKTTYIIEEDATRKDTSYWAEVRPIPLTEEETANLSVVSATGGSLVHRDTSTLSVTLGSGSDNRKKSAAASLVRDLALGKKMKLPKEAYLDFEGLADLKRFSFNTVDGFVAGTGMSLSLKTGHGGRFTLAPSAEYAFSRQRMMWNLSANLLYDPLRSSNIYFRAGRHSDEFSPSGVNPLLNTVSSLLFRENWMKLYNSTYLIAGHRGDLANGLNLSLSAMYEFRQPLTNNASFSIFSRSRPWSDNLPGNPYVNGDGNIQDQLQIFAHRHLSFTSVLTYTPRQRYRLTGTAKINAGSGYPTFALTWKHGYNYNDTLSGHYDLVMADISRTSRYGPMKEFRWRVRGGLFFKNENLQLQDMYFFNTQASPVLINNYEDAFYLKPYYSVSSPDAYAEGHIRYTTPMLVLKRLPGLSSTLTRENVNLSVLWTPDYGCYYEAGYSVSEIFFLAEIGVYAGFRNRSFGAVALRLTLRLD